MRNVSNTRVSDEEERDRLAAELLGHRKYVRETMLPYIQQRLRTTAQWYVAYHAQSRLRYSDKAAWQWNRTPEGRRFPIPSEVFATEEELLQPRRFNKDPQLKEKLAKLSPTPDIPSEKLQLWKDEEHRKHDSWLEEDDIKGEIRFGVCAWITFDEILQNSETTGELLLLPPVSKDAKCLSKGALKEIIGDFFRSKGAEQHPIDEALKQERISLINLLCLRRERFDKYGHFQEPGNIRRGKPQQQEPLITAESVAVLRSTVERIDNKLEKHFQAFQETNLIQGQLREARAARQKAEAAAGLILPEALKKWMRFDPPGMRSGTKALIEKAVKTYVTDPEMRSLAKIAKEFEVTRKTVSVWFSRFTRETGFQVVRHVGHESVKAHLRADDEQKRQHGINEESCDEENGD